MTLSDIVLLALRQLDEDPADVSDYDELFRRYANEGYQIVMREYVKPRAAIALETDKSGRIRLEGLGVARMIELRMRDGCPLGFVLSADGKTIFTTEREKKLEAVVEPEPPSLVSDADEPDFAPWAHSCLADYVCYRHLLSGSAAKQARAQAYLNAFYLTARRIRPCWQGSARRLRNLYAATGTRGHAAGG